MIELHPEKKMPLYEQLYNALAQDIRSGALQPGKALPGRRTMAAQLGISTNTVDTAYRACGGRAGRHPASQRLFVQETGGMLHTRPQHSVVPCPKSHAKKYNQQSRQYFIRFVNRQYRYFPLSCPQLGAHPKGTDVPAAGAAAAG